MVYVVLDRLVLCMNTLEISWIVDMEVCLMPLLMGGWLSFEVLW